MVDSRTNNEASLLAESFKIFIKFHRVIVCTFALFTLHLRLFPFLIHFHGMISRFFFFFSHSIPYLFHFVHAIIIGIVKSFFVIFIAVVIGLFSFFLCCVQFHFRHRSRHILSITFNFHFWWTEILIFNESVSWPITIQSTTSAWISL